MSGYTAANHGERPVIVHNTTQLSADATDSDVFTQSVHLDGYPFPARHDVQIGFGAFPAHSAHTVTTKRDVGLVLN